MVRKLSSMFESLGAKAVEPAGRFSVDAQVFGVTSFFGGDVGACELEVLSDEAFVFKAPPEMVGIGPLWVAGLDEARALKSAVKDAHARLVKRVESEEAKLAALGITPKRKPPEPVAGGELTLGGHVALVTLDATGALLVVEVSGRRVPQKSQQLGIAASDATSETLRSAVVDLVQKMQRAGLLTGRGMFDAATVRGPFAADAAASKVNGSSERSATGTPSAAGATNRGADVESAVGAPQKAQGAGATVVVSSSELSSSPRSDVRRVPRPKRRASSEDARSGHGPAARSQSGAPLRSQTGQAASSSTGAPLHSRIEGEESLLPSPSVDVAETRPANGGGTRGASAAADASRSDASGGSSPADEKNPFGPDSGDTGRAVGFSGERSTGRGDPSFADEDFGSGSATGIGEALHSMPENSEEELMRALEDFSSEEGSLGLSDTGTDVHTAQPPQPTAEASPSVLAAAPTKAPELDQLDDDDIPSKETGEIDAFEDEAEHTAIATSFPVHESKVADDRPPREPLSPPPSKDAPITDKHVPIAREGDRQGSIDEAWRRAETSAKDVAKSATTSEIPLNFDIVEASTGEHPRSFSAEQTFNALANVVGDGLSTGKTGAFILDAEAFAYLRGEEVDDEIQTLEAEIASLEHRLAEARARLIGLKAGKLQATGEAEITAPKGRLAEKKKRLLEERARTTGEQSGELPSLASAIEPSSASLPSDAPSADEKGRSAEEGIALADVARALGRDDEPRVESTQLVAASYSHLDVDDDDGVFDSRQEQTGAVGVDISMNSDEGQGAPDAPSSTSPPRGAVSRVSEASSEVEVDADGETRLADIRSLSGNQAGPIGIVVADARALDRLTRHLAEDYDQIIGLSLLPSGADAAELSAYRALVLVRPRPDGETLERLKLLASSRRRPQVLCLSTDTRFDEAAGIDLRIELAKKAGEVAQQVKDGLKQLGVSASAR